jgi:hypothetical protein
LKNAAATADALPISPLPADIGAQAPVLCVDLRDSAVRGVGVGDYGCWTEAAALAVGEEMAGMHA